MEIQGVNITYIMGNILSYISCVKEYNWNDRFCKENTIENLKSFEKALSKIDFTKCRKEELLAIGCSMWRIESNLVLIPIWLYRCLPNGTKLTSIMGNEKVIGRDEIDTDIRGGCMAFGLIIED